MRILIVDDNRDHGNIIKTALATAGFIAEFYHYDENFLNQIPQADSVRIIFSDLNLGGDGIEGAKNYAVVGAVLEKVVKDSNGPYALITWTTFAAQAEGLHAYIKERCGAHCHPISFRVIDKEAFIKPGAIDDLKNKVLESFSEFPAMRAVLEWESAVAVATTSVLNKLENIASINGNFDKRLHQVFTKLAEAEGGSKAISRDDITHPLLLVLGRLLHDELTNCSITSLPAQKDENFDAFDPKKPSLNSMLHLHATPPSLGAGGSLPGLVFAWPEENAVGGIPPIADRAEFAKKEFLKSSAKPEEIARCTLVMIDVTPSCDHSQNQISWRRFIGAILVPNDLKRLSDASSEGAGRLCKLPVMEINGSEAFLVLNSQLYVSVPNGRENLAGLKEPMFQLREQIYSDCLGWIGRQVSRQGYTSFIVK